MIAQPSPIRSSSARMLETSASQVSGMSASAPRFRVILRVAVSSSGLWTMWACGRSRSAAIGGPHLVQDDGRLIAAYVELVKGADPRSGTLLMAVDQSFHVLALFLLANRD